MTKRDALKCDMESLRPERQYIICGSALYESHLLKLDFICNCNARSCLGQKDNLPVETSIPSSLYRIHQLHYFRHSQSDVTPSSLLGFVEMIPHGCATNNLKLQS